MKILNILIIIFILILAYMIITQGTCSPSKKESFECGCTVSQARVPHIVNPFIMESDCLQPDIVVEGDFDPDIYITPDNFITPDMSILNTGDHREQRFNESNL